MGADADYICPKCRNDLGNWRAYQPASPSKPAIPPRLFGLIPGKPAVSGAPEHMKWHCIKCGYTWRGLTEDAKRRTVVR